MENCACRAIAPVSSGTSSRDIRRRKTQVKIAPMKNGPFEGAVCFYRSLVCTCPADVPRMSWGTSNASINRLQLELDRTSRFCEFSRSRRFHFAGVCYARIASWFTLRYRIAAGRFFRRISVRQCLHEADARMLIAVTHRNPLAAVKLDVNGLFAERTDHGIFAAKFFCERPRFFGTPNFCAIFGPRALFTLSLYVNHSVLVHRVSNSLAFWPSA